MHIQATVVTAVVLSSDSFDSGESESSLKAKCHQCVSESCDLQLPVYFFSAGHLLMFTGKCP